MELENFRKNIHEKKFQDAFLCLQKLLSNEESDLKSISQLFLDLDKNEINLPEKFYLIFAKFFLNNGKIKLAETSIIHYLNILKINKRFKTFEKMKSDQDFLVNKLILKNISEVEAYLEKSKGSLEVTVDQYEDYHHAYWGRKQEFLKEEILNSHRWDIGLIKKSYEYILKYGPDEEVILKVYKNANQKFEVLFLKYFGKNKIKFKDDIENETSINNLKMDYDQIAFNIISGKSNSEESEQDKVIESLKYIDEFEFANKYEDILVAFKLLNMNLVCLEIIQQALEKLDLTEDKLVSVKYIQAQCYFDQENYFESMVIIDEMMTSQLLNNDMLLGFIKLKIEICKITKRTDEVIILNKMIKKIKSGID